MTTTTTTHRDPRQRLSYHHHHRDPRQRLSHHHHHRDPRQGLSHYRNPPNFVPPTGGAAQNLSHLHPHIENFPPRALIPRTSPYHNPQHQSRNRGDAGSTHTRRYQPPWGSYPPNIHYPLRKTQSPRMPTKLKNPRHPAENPRDPRVTPVTWGSLLSSPQRPRISSDPTNTTITKLTAHLHRKRCWTKSPRSIPNPARRSDPPSDSVQLAKSTPVTDNR